MFLGTRSLYPLGFPGVLLEKESDLEWFENVFRTLWAFILSVLNTITKWMSGPSLTRMFQALWDAYSFVQKHPHPFHILGWSIFFGPIIIIVPCLILLEILILVLFQLGFISHGLFSGPLVDRFDTLRDYFMDWRESLFANVEQWTAIFNKWTVDYPPLLVLRLLAGSMSLFILFGLWSGL